MSTDLPLEMNDTNNQAYSFGNTLPDSVDLVELSGDIETAFTEIIELEISETERDLQDIDILLNRASGPSLDVVSVTAHTVLTALMDSIGIE